MTSGLELVDQTAFAPALDELNQLCGQMVIGKLFDPETLKWRRYRVINHG
jgi:hypothetical protein